MIFDNFLDWIQDIFDNFGNNASGLPDDVNDFFELLTDSGVDLSNLSSEDMDALIDYLDGQGIDIGEQGFIDDSAQEIGNNLDSEVSFGCSCGGNCHMVCQNSCASACLSSYSH